MTTHWRLAQESDDPHIVDMCWELNTEDPCAAPVPKSHTQQTLAMLRAQPVRGKAVVLDTGEAVVGYALLISYWSNELGGEVCVLDEIYVRPNHRSKGLAAVLVENVLSGRALWRPRPVAIELEVSPKNVRARALYERLGFSVIRNARMRKVLD